MRPPRVKPSPNVPSAKAPIATTLRQTESRCQWPSAASLLLGQLLAAPLLAQGAPGLEAEVEVVEDLRSLFRHAPSV